jgi:HSP20 family molecular chaperone IbpA
VLCLEMPGCNGRDLTVDLQGNTITIEGYNRRPPFSDGDGYDDEDTDHRLPKRQRLRRRFSIPDPTLLAIEQGIATLHKGCLTLYAPKRIQ